MKSNVETAVWHPTMLKQQRFHSFISQIDKHEQNTVQEQANVKQICKNMQAHKHKSTQGSHKSKWICKLHTRARKCTSTKRTSTPM